MSHKWFKSINWEEIEEQKAIAPFIPKQNTDNFSNNQVNGVDRWLEDNQQLMKDNKSLLRKDHIQEQFKGYLYIPGIN